MASKRTPSPAPAYTGIPMPDRRLASDFVRRSKDAPLSARNICILGAYTPETSALRDGLLAGREDMTVGVARVSAGAQNTAPEIVHEVHTDVETDCRAVARTLNMFDVVLIEHRFGVYGGPDGEQVLRILEWVRVPTVAVLHDAAAKLSEGQAAVLQELTYSVDAIVTLNDADRRRVQEDFQVSPRKVMVIAHDAADGQLGADWSEIAGQHQRLFNALLGGPA
jgi:polysaccharide biosynthesis protein PslF